MGDTLRQSRRSALAQRGAGPPPHYHALAEGRCVQPQSRAPVLTVLHDADFRTIWCVGGLSEVARWMEHLVLSWLIWQVTRSPLPLALVLVFNNLPRPLCSPFTGLLADRFSRRRILIGAQLLNTATALAVLALLILERLQPWQVLVAVSLQGVVKSLEDPGTAHGHPGSRRGRATRQRPIPGRAE